MGYWFLIIFALVISIILYAWIIEESNGHKVPVLILMGITLAFLVWMAIIGQWYCFIGIIVGSLLGSFFSLFFSPDRAHQKKLKGEDLVYKRNCWNCGEVFDIHDAKTCDKCHSHYKCPHCGKCYCDDPRHKDEIRKQIDKVPQPEIERKNLPSKNLNQ